MVASEKQDKIVRSSRLEVFFKKSILKVLQMLTGKPVPESLVKLSPALLKRDSRTGVFL